MNRPLFAIIFIALAVLVLFGMWWGWRARSRRDHSVTSKLSPFSGELIAEFSRIMYVSTTPAGEPLVRVAAPGLRYRGLSDIRVYTEGIEVGVTGESPVRIPANAISGTDNARVRVGKAVERNGLTLLLWHEAENSYESTFRFESHETEKEFTGAVEQLVHASRSTAHAPTDLPQINQEDVR